MEALAGVAEAVLGTRDVAAAASFVLGYAIVAASAALKVRARGARRGRAQASKQASKR